MGIHAGLWIAGLPYEASSAQSSRPHSEESSAQTHLKQGSAEFNVSFDTASPMDEAP